MAEPQETQIGQNPFRRSTDRPIQIDVGTDLLKIPQEDSEMNVPEAITKSKKLSALYLPNLNFDPSQISGTSFPENWYWIELAKNTSRTENILGFGFEQSVTDTREQIELKEKLFKLAIINTDKFLEAKTRERTLLGELYINPLTGLLNRKFDQEVLPKRIEEESGKGKKFARLRLDIDNFRKYNNLMSHEFGDKTIQAVAQIIYYATRSTDLVIHVSGDEFVVMLEGDNAAKGAEKVATRILRMAKSDPRLFLPESKGLISQNPGTVSIGIATNDGKPITLAQLDRNADAAAIVSKEKGKGQYTIFQPGMEIKK